MKYTKTVKTRVKPNELRDMFRYCDDLVNERLEHWLRNPYMPFVYKYYEDGCTVEP